MFAREDCKILLACSYITLAVSCVLFRFNNLTTLRSGIWGGKGWGLGVGGGGGGSVLYNAISSVWQLTHSGGLKD